MSHSADFIEGLGRARLAGQPIPADAEGVPEGADAGYLAQADLGAWFAAHGAGPQAGWKIGATTSAMQDYLNAGGPAYGRVFSANVHLPGVRLAASDFCSPAIECELAFRMATDLAPRDAPWTGDEIAERVDAIAPAIEIVENRYGDFRTRGLGVLVADDFFHKACVLGGWRADWRDLDLVAMKAEARVNGEVVQTGNGAAVLGHPLEALVWLANTLSAQGRTLQAGAPVLTGSMTLVHWLTAFPAELEVRQEGMDPVGCALV